jgi:hypothetical protein
MWSSGVSHEIISVYSSLSECLCAISLRGDMVSFIDQGHVLFRYVEHDTIYWGFLSIIIIYVFLNGDTAI